jgi:hypothetical protein
VSPDRHAEHEEHQDSSMARLCGHWPRRQIHVRGEETNLQASGEEEAPLLFLNLARDFSTRATPAHTGSAPSGSRRRRPVQHCWRRTLGLGQWDNPVASRDDANPVSWHRRGVFCEIHAGETSSRDALYLDYANTTSL